MKEHFTEKQASEIGSILRIRWDNFSVSHFQRGMNVELEHGLRNISTNVTDDDPILTGKIALAHLNEFPDYYDRLEKMEKEAGSYWEKTDKKLMGFVSESRKRGFSDKEIIKSLVSRGWPAHEIEKVFIDSSLHKEVNLLKNQVCIDLDSDLMKIIEKRAKKNLLSVHEQIKDTLRRSCINLSTSTKPEKLDDALVGVFSRKSKKKMHKPSP